MEHASPKIGLIVNPAARRAGQYLSNDRFWERHLPPAQICVTENLDDLDQAVADHCTGQNCVIACLGGDGTLHHLVNAMVRQEASAAILALAGGTLNGLARAFGTGGQAERVFLRALAAKEVPVRTQTTLRIGGSAPRFGFTMAAGLATPAARAYADRRRRGGGAVMWSVLEAAAGRFGDHVIGVSVHDGPFEAARLVVAGTVSRPFLFIRPFGPRPVPPDAFCLTRLAMARRQIFPRLWPILRGTARHPGFAVGTARHAQIDTLDDVVIDGELHTPNDPGPLRVSLGPTVVFFDLSGAAPPRGLTARTALGWARS